MNRPRAGEPTSVQRPTAIASVLAVLRGTRSSTAPSSRPRLSRSLMGRSSAEIDWRLTIIAALSFLAHFGVVGSIYSDWLDPLVDDGPTIEGLVDALRIVPAPVELVPAPSAQASVLVSTVPSEPHAGSSSPSVGRGAARPSGGGDRTRLLAEASAREMAIISALGGSGTTSNSLRDGQATSQLLDGVAADQQGVTPGHGSGLHLGEAGGAVIAPGRRSGLTDVGGTTAGVPTGAGSGITVKPPSSITTIDPPAVTGDVPRAEQTVAGLKAGYRRCYMRGLEATPDAQGSVQLRVKIGPNGEVASVTTSGGAQLGSEIVSCLVRHTAQAHFEAPKASSGTIVIPITFALQR
jgi:hypothetical protein